VVVHGRTERLSIPIYESEAYERAVYDMSKSMAAVCRHAQSDRNEA
jgi:hypothetical protein